MPSLPFVLPHWLYWGTLVVFPIVAMYFVQREHRRGVPRGPSLFIAYMFWLCSGFMGLHRFYLRNNWGFVFIPVFLLILHTTDVIRDKREDVSRTRAAVGAAVSELDHAKIPPGVTATPQMQERLAKAEAAQPKVKSDFEEAQADLDAMVQLFALAGDPDGRDAGRRRDPAARSRAQAEDCARPRSGQTRRPRSCRPTCRKSAPMRIRRSACIRDSPTRSNG